MIMTTSPTGAAMNTKKPMIEIYVTSLINNNIPMTIAKKHRIALENMGVVL